MALLVNVLLSILDPLVDFRRDGDCQQPLGAVTQDVGQYVFAVGGWKRDRGCGSFQHGGWLLGEMGLKTRNHFTSEPPPLQFPRHNFRSYLASKTHLYEGGIRSPLVVWAPGLTNRQNHVDRESVFSAIDLAPTLLDLTDTTWPEGVKFDGEYLPATLMGEAGSRQKPLYFRRPPDRDAFYGDDDLPDLAMRDGKWKLLCEYDSSEPELYDLSTDRGETRNLVDVQPELVERLTKILVAWHQSMPQDNGATFAIE